AGRRYRASHGPDPAACGSPAGATPTAALSSPREITDEENAGPQRQRAIHGSNRAAAGVAAIARAAAARAGAANGIVQLEQTSLSDSHRAVVGENGAASRALSGGPGTSRAGAAPCDVGAQGRGRRG